MGKCQLGAKFSVCYIRVAVISGAVIKGEINIAKAWKNSGPQDLFCGWPLYPLTSQPGTTVIVYLFISPAAKVGSILAKIGTGRVQSRSFWTCSLGSSTNFSGLIKPAKSMLCCITQVSFNFCITYLRRRFVSIPAQIFGTCVAEN